MTTKLWSFKAHIPMGTAADGSPVLMSPEFQRYLDQGIFPRVGNATALSNTELEQAIEQAQTAPAPQSNTIPDALELRFEPFTPADDPQARIEALEARVQQLAGIVFDIQKGPQP